MRAKDGVPEGTPSAELGKPVSAEILPPRVGLLDECDFFRTQPALELFLTGNRDSRLRATLVIHQPGNPVLRGESRMDPGAMLLHPPGQVIGDAHIEYSAPAGQDIHEVLSHSRRYHPRPSTTNSILRARCDSCARPFARFASEG